MEPDDDTEIGICSDIRCPCGSDTQYSAADTKTVYTCTQCGQWVATITTELADGALILDEPIHP